MTRDLILAATAVLFVATLAFRIVAARERRALARRVQPPTLADAIQTSGVVIAFPDPKKRTRFESKRRV